MLIIFCIDLIRFKVIWEKIGETCITAERVHACIHSNLGMNALCFFSSSEKELEVLLHQHFYYHMSALMWRTTCTCKVCFLALLWKIFISCCLHRGHLAWRGTSAEKKNKKGWGWSWKEGWVEPNAAPREEEAGSMAHRGLASQTGAQLRGRGPEFRMSSSVWAEREPTPSPPNNPGQSRF
jgi:hypothetical protein